MDETSIFPPTPIVTLAIGLSIARFENQRWVRAWQQGLIAEPEPKLAFGITLIGFTGMLFGMIFLIAFAFDFGILSAGVLIGVTWLAGLLFSLFSAIIFGIDNTNIWIIGTLSIWPIMYFLFQYVSWFGFLELA